MGKRNGEIVMNKENALNNFYEMIKQSWTYAKLTEHEKAQFKIVLYSRQVEKCLKGTYKQRWEILQAIYSSFLMALDYTPIGWREDLDEIPLF